MEQKICELKEKGCGGCPLLLTDYEEQLDLRQYFGQKKLKDYADFFSSSSSLCCGVI